MKCKHKFQFVNGQFYESNGRHKYGLFICECGIFKYVKLKEMKNSFDSRRR